LSKLNENATRGAVVREVSYIVTIIVLIITVIAVKAAPGAAPEPIVYNVVAGEAEDVVEAAGEVVEGDLPGDEPVGNSAGSKPSSSGKSSQPAKVTAGQKININTAGSAQLQRLPGVGPSKAQAIIDYRDANGGFSTIDEIKRVKGIGDATFNGFRDNITVE